MVFRKRPRRFRRKRPIARKSKFSTKMMLGQKHQKVIEDTNLSMETFTAVNRYKSEDISSIGLGDDYAQRQTNNILSKGLSVTMVMNNNNIGSDRYLRMTIVALRGSQTGADVSTWTNLFINSDYSTLAPDGSNTTVKRINKDLYKVWCDKVFKIPATPATVNESKNSKFVKMWCPFRKIIKYGFNTLNVREHACFFVLTLCESAGNILSTASLDIDYSLRFFFTDITGFKPR